MYMLLYMVVMLVVSYAITASMTKSAVTKPVAGQLDIPTAAEGANIPVCFGTNLMTQSNVAWYGNPSTKPIKTKSGKK